MTIRSLEGTRDSLDTISPINSPVLKEPLNKLDTQLL